MTQINFVALKLITSNPVICVKFYVFVVFLDIYYSCSHDRDFMNGYADELKNIYFKDFTVTAPHFKNVQKGRDKYIIHKI